MTRILVVSDIHSNFYALDAVIKDAGTFDQIWCLGDVVGYGPQPNECIDCLCGFDTISMAGNHDLGVAGKLGLWDFTPDARELIFFTRHVLSPANFEWLHNLREGVFDTGQGISLVHASPREPVWEYIYDREMAKFNLEYINTPVCLNGHTHIPNIYRKPWDGLKILEETLRVNSPVRLTMDRMFINPGSVGQPRDEDPRAAYAVINLEDMTLTHHRVEYDVAGIQKIMKQAKLPARLIRRLRFGQ